MSNNILIQDADPGEIYRVTQEVIMRLSKSA
jgi:hypothetical protein